MVKRKNYNKIVGVIRYALAFLSAVPLVVFFLSLFTAPNLVVGSDIFIIYFIIQCFTLPSLISKVLLKRDLLGLPTVLCFLIYPAIYLAALGLSNLGLGQITAILNIFGVLALFAWHALTFRYIVKADFEHIDETFTGVLLSLIPFVIYLFLISFFRSYDSVISTDILVHKTVLNGMESIKTFSILPAGYSNMFTDQGYPVIFYHTFLLFINDAFNLSFVKVAYYIDLIFTLIASITLFKVYFNYFKSYGWAVLAATLTILSFENIAYSTQYFVPQTMTFWFFLQIISNKALRFRDLLLAVPALITAHFFMGAYFAGLLIVKTLFVDKYFSLGRLKLPRITITKYLAILLFISILLSFAGFSIETSFQSSTLKEIGIISNPAFFEKISTIFNIFGLNILLIIPILIIAFREQINRKNISFAFVGILVALIMYFLAPTFAAKFFLGFGFFIVIILVTFLEEIKYKRNILKYLLAVMLIISFGVNFVQQYNNSLPFLRQESGMESAIVDKDKSLIDFWAKSKNQCVIISDPETQIELHSLGKGNSVRGYYMTLESRAILADFIRNPNLSNLSELYNLSEIPDKQTPLCVAVTSRLEELINNNYAWLDVIYNYKIDHSKQLAGDDKVINFFTQSGFKELYSDEYTQIFRIR